MTMGFSVIFFNESRRNFHIQVFPLYAYDLDVVCIKIVCVCLTVGARGVRGVYACL